MEKKWKQLVFFPGDIYFWLFFNIKTSILCVYVRGNLLYFHKLNKKIY